jgi:hypothetical protein
MAPARFPTAVLCSVAVCRGTPTYLQRRAADAPLQVGAERIDCLGRRRRARLQQAATQNNVLHHSATRCLPTVLLCKPVSSRCCESELAADTRAHRRGTGGAKLRPVDKDGTRARSRLALILCASSSTRRAQRTLCNTDADKSAFSISSSAASSATSSASVRFFALGARVGFVAGAFRFVLSATLGCALALRFGALLCLAAV